MDRRIGNGTVQDGADDQTKGTGENASAGDQSAGLAPLYDSVEQAQRKDRLVDALADKDRSLAAVLADLTPDSAAALAQRARAANVSQLIGARANISLAFQNAPKAFADTGSYTGVMPKPEDFAYVFGVEEGRRQLAQLDESVETGKQAFDMRVMPARDINSQLLDAAVGAASSPDVQSRYRITAAAARHVQDARNYDPAGEAGKAFPRVKVAWRAAVDQGWRNPVSVQNALALTIAAQQYLGIENIQPLPRAVLEALSGLPPQDIQARIDGLLAGAPDTGTKLTMSRQFAEAGLVGDQEQARAATSVADLAHREAIIDPMGLLDLGKTVGQGQSIADAELTGYVPNLQEQLGNFIAGDSPRGSFRRFVAQKLVGSDGLGEDGFSAADVTPVGAAFALDRAGAAALEGRYGSALFEAAGAIPADRLVAPIFKRAGKIAEPLVERLSDFSKRSDELEDGALVHGVDAATLRFQQGLAQSTSKSESNTSKRRLENEMLGAMLARDPARVRYEGATVGWETSKDYRKTFFDVNKKLNPNDYVVHHGVEQQVFDRYPGLFTEEEINSLENLRGVRKVFDTNLHKKVFRREWDDFYATHPAPTRQEILDKVTEIDKKYGQLFDPPLGE